MPVTDDAKRWKLIGAIALVMGALIFVYAQYMSTRPPDPSEVRTGRARFAAQDGGRAEQLSREERRQRREDRQRQREEMFQQMNLTADQRRQIEALPPIGREAGPEARQARRQAMAEILTPEQLEQMRQIRRQRRQRGPGQGPADQP
jgi:Spy/CpxP family protein refolding chaperone